MKASQWLNTAWKELAVGSTLSLTMGIVAGCICYAWGEMVVGVGVGVGLALVAVVVVSHLLGVLFPVLLTTLGIDPAVASSHIYDGCDKPFPVFFYCPVGDR